MAYPHVPIDSVKRGPRILLIGPEMKRPCDQSSHMPHLPVSAKRPYKTPLAVSERTISSIPPAPRFWIALDMPTEQKHTNPTRKTCVHGELSTSVRPAGGLTSESSSLDLGEVCCNVAHGAVRKVGKVGCMHSCEYLYQQSGTYLGVPWIPQYMTAISHSQLAFPCTSTTW